MYSWRVWVLAYAESGGAGFHCLVSGEFLSLRFCLTSCMHHSMFAYALSRCNLMAKGCI